MGGKEDRRRPSRCPQHPAHHEVLVAASRSCQLNAILKEGGGVGLQQHPVHTRGGKRSSRAWSLARWHSLQDAPHGSVAVIPHLNMPRDTLRRMPGEPATILPVFTRVRCTMETVQKCCDVSTNPPTPACLAKHAAVVEGARDVFQHLRRQPAVIDRLQTTNAPPARFMNTIPFLAPEWTGQIVTCRNPSVLRSYGCTGSELASSKL